MQRSSPVQILKRQSLPGWTRALSAVSAVLLFSGCTSLQDEVETTDAGAKAQIQRRLQAILEACETKSFSELDSYHLYGPKFSKFSPSSPDRLDAAASRNGEHVGLGAATNLKMAADALKIDVFGQVAIATFILRYSSDSGSAEARDRTTMVFVKDGSGWRIAHEHLSPLKP